MRRLDAMELQSPQMAEMSAAIDSQIEVDQVSGGVGFDDEPIDPQWLIELRNKQKLRREKE